MTGSSHNSTHAGGRCDLHCSNACKVLRGETGLWSVGAHAVDAHWQTRHCRQPHTQPKNLTAALSITAVNLNRSRCSLTTACRCSGIFSADPRHKVTGDGIFQQKNVGSEGYCLAKRAAFVAIEQQVKQLFS